MKVLSKAQLKERAEKVFKKNPQLREAYATVDGQIFESENRAELHQASLKSKVNPVKFENENYQAPKGNQDLDKGTQELGYQDLLKAIKNAQSSEELEGLVSEDEDRKTVLSAVAKKEAEFNSGEAGTEEE